MKELLPNWTTEHVKGHQDKKTSIQDLNWEGRLNVRADELATAAKIKIFEKPERHKVIAYPANKATLCINNKII